MHGRVLIEIGKKVAKFKPGKKIPRYSGGKPIPQLPAPDKLKGGLLPLKDKKGRPLKPIKPPRPVNKKIRLPKKRK